MNAMFKKSYQKLRIYRGPIADTLSNIVCDSKKIQSCILKIFTCYTESQ